jgi:cytochrome c oxidase subunit 4
MPDAGPTRTVYITIYLILMLLLAATIAVAFLDLGPFNTLLAMSIAMLKAVLVVLFFMHVRYEGGLAWLAALGGVVWLSILISLTLCDFLTRSWLR